MTILSENDHDIVDQFLTRVLELHRDGVLATDDAVAHLGQFIGALDRQSGEAKQFMTALLAEAWDKDDDA